MTRYTSSIHSNIQEYERWIQNSNIKNAQFIKQIQNFDKKVKFL